MDKFLLAVDPGEQTGFALLDTETGEVIAQGTLKPEVVRILVSVVSEYKIHDIVIETTDKNALPPSVRSVVDGFVLKRKRMVFVRPAQWKPWARNHKPTILSTKHQKEAVSQGEYVLFLEKNK